jgi:spermidine/putrescine transport system substrate-binding protein
MTRRVTFLAVLVSVLVMAACAPAGSGSGEQQELHIYNWATYIDPELLDEFQEKFNAKIIYDTFGSNEDLLAKIEPGNPGYDIIVPSDYMVTTMADEGLLITLDHSKLPNLSNLDDQFANPPYDPGLVHCVPYQWGTLGLGYDITDTGEEIDSWSAVFEPQHPFSLLDDPRVVLGTALIYQGHDPNTTDPEEIQQALDLLLSIKDDVVAFAPDTGQDLLITGEVALALEYSGDIFQIMTDTEISDHDNYRYVIPKEGALIWTDNMCIPEGAPNPDLAHEFINFILDAENGARLSNFIAYGTPNKASMPMIVEEQRNNPGIYPSEETKEKLYFIRSLGEDDVLYQEAWQQLGLGQ